MVTLTGGVVSALGKGIAANPNNFGATGAKPTHPELLDWLSTEFVRRDWDVKYLHRLIVTSATFRVFCHTKS